MMPFETYLNPTIKPIADAVALGKQQSPLDSHFFIPFYAATDLMKPGYFEVENGYCLNTDGSVFVSVLTEMPRVTPVMWHWWFGWHGDDSRKYKLWHPLAHTDIYWQDSVVGRQAYIDRVSIVTESIGSNSDKAAIQFKRPSIVGLPNFDDDSADVVYIVAQLGLPRIPLNYGWLIHQVRKTETGAEMRSRFWLGGQYVVARDGYRHFSIAAAIARRVRKVPVRFGNDMMVHCAEEMAHLAAFLPDLYADYNQHKASANRT